MFLWPSQKEERLSLSANMDVAEDEVRISRTEVGGVTSTVMEQPHFTGEDEKGRRWSFKAKEAVQKRFQNASETMVLNEVGGFSTLVNGQKIQFEAGSGTLQNENGNISLKGQVKIIGYGYTLKTSEISGNMQNMHLKSKDTVHITSPQGFLEAGRFEVIGENGKIIFDKGVQLRLSPPESFIKIDQGGI